MPLTDNTAQWGVRKLTKFQENSGIPVGFEYFSTNPNIPTGSLPLFGGEYSRTVYADLWSWVQEQAGYLIEESVWQEKSAANEGNVPFYSKGDGSTTFRVPSLKCWVRGANGIEEVGSYLSAGLPILPDMSHTHERGTMNITGEITYITANTGDISNTDFPTTGAFRWGDEAYTQKESLTSGTGSRDLSFDASRSWTGETSSASLTRTTDIYGNSNTVQPKSIVGMWLVKAYGTVTNVGSTDVSNIAQGLTELETNKLSLSGGTMTGDLKFVNDAFRIRQTISANGALEDNFDVGWMYYDRRGAGIGLRGGNFNGGSDSAGGFSIYARNSTDATSLDGTPRGILTWGNKKVALQGSLSMPSSKYVNISLSGFVANSDSKYYSNIYTAPADGWIFIYCTLSSSPTSGYKISLNNVTKGYSIRFIHTKTNIGRDLSFMLPITKGDVFEMDTAWISAISEIKFFYAQSEV